MNPENVFQRYRTLQTGRLHTMPIAILMPHSACNCRCIMCDIWKENSHKKQFDENVLHGILTSLRKLKTQLVVLSGGEALMHPKLFDFCELIRAEGIRISILSSGLLLERHAQAIVDHTDEVIVSLDGPEYLHNQIRNIPDAYQKLRMGVRAIKKIKPGFAISGRCVIQQLNFQDLPAIITSAKEIPLDRISFLGADISSVAFNRPEEWNDEKKQEILLKPDHLAFFKKILEQVFIDFKNDFASGFIVESPDGLRRIHNYYTTRIEGKDFTAPFCTAPWVSAVVEADGVVRPCYFHEPYGNLSQGTLHDILNSEQAISFRKKLDIENNPVCKNCVCSLNLRPFDPIP
jgi:Fe-coproporphyrin III synthase